MPYDGNAGEPWFGFGRVRGLNGLPPEVLMVPLLGHPWGHAGVAVQGERGWLLMAGDACFPSREDRLGKPLLAATRSFHVASTAA